MRTRREAHGARDARPAHEAPGARGLRRAFGWHVDTLIPLVCGIAALALALALGLILITAGSVWGQPGDVPTIPVEWSSDGPCGGTVTALLPTAVPTSRGSFFLVAATFGGGVFTSWDDGRTWARSGGLTSYFITSLAVSGHRPDTFLAGVESRESYRPLVMRSKLIKSTNAGVTWFESSDGIQNDSDGRSIPQAVAFSSGDPDVAFAGCISIGWLAPPPRMYKSTNGGSSWFASNAGHAGESYSICVHPCDANRVFSGSSAGIYRSVDGGATWTLSPVSGGPVKAILASRENPSIAVAANAGGIRRSTDSGETWYEVAGPGAPDTMVTCLFDHPILGGPLFAGTEDGSVFISDDIGESWALLTADRVPGALRCLYVSIDDMMCLAGTEHRGIFRWGDSPGWAWSSTGLDAAIVRSCWIRPDGTLLAGLERLGLVRKSAAGPALGWTRVEGIGDEETILCIAEHPLGPDTLLAGSRSGGPVGTPGFLYKSIDGGASWSAARAFPGDVCGIGLDAQQPGRIYVAVSGDSLYVSQDGGATWSGNWFGGGGYEGVAVNPWDGTRILVPAHAPWPYDDAGVFRSTDAGESWELRQFCYPTNIAHDPTAPAFAYSGQGQDWGVWRSVDGGETWAILPNFPGGAHETHVGVEPGSGDLWGSKSRLGVYLSGDHGDSWTDASGGLVNRSVTALAARRFPWSGPIGWGPAAAITLVCTDGAGVWTAEDVATGVRTLSSWDETGGSARAPRRAIAWPNPSRGEVRFALDRVSSGSPIVVQLLDSSGRLVTEMVVPASAGAAVWDGSDASGRRVAPGAYWVRARVDGESAIGRVTILR